MSVMPPIGKRGRRDSSLVAVVALTLSLVASCKGADKFELTLRGRDDASSSPTHQLQWRAADGRHATSPEYWVFPDGTGSEFGNVDCGGQSWVRSYFSVLGPELASRDDSYELKIDDGKGLMLDPQTEVFVSGGTGGGTACFEETGRWEGTTGDVLNRTGTFTLHYDSIQTVLRLVED